MAQDLKNIGSTQESGHASHSDGCDSICPQCNVVHNDCVLDANHHEPHQCVNGHHWT